MVAVAAEARQITALQHKNRFVDFPLCAKRAETPHFLVAARTFGIIVAR